MTGSELSQPAGEQPIRITADMLEPEPTPDSRVDFEKGMSYAPSATLLLIVAIAAAFAWQLSVGALKDQASIIAAGALVREQVIQGEVWRLLSATLLHGNVEHLLGNAVSLYILGMACEHSYGARSMLVVYLASGIAGSLLSVANGPGPSVGASGAIFGLMGAVLVLFWKHHSALLVRDKRVGIVVAAWAILTIITGFVTPMVDNAGHVGGLLGGMVTAWSMRPKILDRKVVYLARPRYRLR